MISVKQIGPIKFKNKQGMNRFVLNIKKTFGFMPETLIIDKVLDSNNKIIISAVVLPKDEKKQAELIA